MPTPTVLPRSLYSRSKGGNKISCRAYHRIASQDTRDDILHVEGRLLSPFKRFWVLLPSIHGVAELLCRSVAGPITVSTPLLLRLVWLYKPHRKATNRFTLSSRLST
jgi:hypothetical protein